MYYLGVDLGGTNIKAALVDADGAIIKEASTPTKLPRPAEAVCDDIAALCNQLAQGQLVAGIGVGCPGTVDGGLVRYSNNLGWHDFAMGDYLETASFGTIVLAVLLLAYHRWMKKEKIPVWGMGSVLTMLAGFLFMMTAPGTLKNKVATSGLHGYVDNFINAMDLYVEHLLILLLILIVLIVCSVILEWYKTVSYTHLTLPTIA